MTTPTPPNPDDEMRSALEASGAIRHASLWVEQLAVAAVRGMTSNDNVASEAIVGYIRDESVRATLIELRRRGAWLPGDPVTDAMVFVYDHEISKRCRYKHDWEDIRTAITAALNARGET